MLYINAFWFVSVTMATVGYGDYTPNTITGRCFSFIICLWGIFYVSITFVSLINIIKLSVNEQNAFTLIKKLKMYNELRNTASSMITCFIRFGILAKKIKLGASFVDKTRYYLAANRLKMLLIQFKSLRT